MGQNLNVLEISNEELFSQYINLEPLKNERDTSIVKYWVSSTNSTLKSFALDMLSIPNKKINIRKEIAYTREMIEQDKNLFSGDAILQRILLKLYTNSLLVDSLYNLKIQFKLTVEMNKNNIRERNDKNATYI